MSRVEACLLCGAERETRFELVRWIEPADTFAALPRCTDRTACRTRVEANGERWPVADATELDTRNGPQGFSEAHRRAFETARKWRERKAAQ